MNGSISKGRITLPLSKATTDAIHLYRNRSPPPQDDGLIRYNIALGKGKGAKWLSHNPGIHFRKVPCAELRSVQDILRTERGECILAPRLDINQRRQQHDERQRNNRSPQQWNDVVVNNEERIRQLEEDIQSMMRQLQEKDTALKRAADNERYARLNFGNEKKRMKRTIISLQKDVDAATSTCEQSDSFNQFITLVSNHDGISRLTIFNDTWHAKNSHAAKIFWGYPSWEGTKL